MATEAEVEELLGDLRWLLDFENTRPQKRQMTEILTRAIAYIESVQNQGQTEEVNILPDSAMFTEVEEVMQPPKVGHIRDVQVGVEVNLGGRSGFLPDRLELRRQIYDGTGFKDWESPEATLTLNYMFSRIRDLETKCHELDQRTVGQVQAGATNA